MPDFAQFPLAANVALFLVATGVIALAGWRLAGQADRLADVTGLGEALAGALFLGASTSLPGITTSAVTAWRGFPEFAVSNAVGGIAAQTAFLAVADIFYRKVNLEHAAASASNILLGTLLITLLSVPLLAASGPNVAVFGINPASIILVLGYIYGMRLVSRARDEPMWRPQHTPETRADEPDPDPLRGKSVSSLWIAFAVTAAIVGAAGWIVAQTGMAVASTTGLSETAVGGFFTAVSTSLPELVTAVAAVRQGSLTLAVGGIIGGNSFDTLFIAVADVAYRDGSIYHHISNRQTFLMALTILLTGILVMGLVRREKRGIANIGFESFSILLIYAAAIAFMFTAR